MIWTTQIPEKPGIYWAVSKMAMDAGLCVGPIVAMCTAVDGVVEVIHFLGAPGHWHVQGRRSMDDHGR